jgi:NADP-dependent 3-hydroxy acid dehydrogenase YdfG
MTKRAIVTGASSGIGEATVRQLAAAGWEVIGVARRADRLAAVERDLEAAGTPIRTLVADVTRQEDVDRLREEAAALGTVDALVSVAGGAFGMESVEDSDPEDWRQMFDVNVLGVLRMVQALLPLLRDAARTGGVADVMTVTSTAATVAYEGGGGYNAAKAGAHMLMAVLRLELAGEPIRVVEVAPGMVKTEEFSLKRFRGDQERVDKLYDNVLEPLVADDIARTMVETLQLPRHVNLDLITMRPVAQAAQHKVARGPLLPRDA